MEKPNLGKTSTGLDANIAGFLCYIVGWVSGLIFYLIEKENKFVRFHAMQSIVVFGFLNVLVIVLGVLPFINFVLLPFLWLITIALWIILMIKAYQGEFFKLPIAGDIAEKKS